MKNWKYILFLTPALLVLAGAAVGIHQDLPIIKMVTEQVGGTSKIVTAETIHSTPEDESTSQNLEEAELVKEEVKQGKWKDGVYLGSAMGYGGNIQVSVTIKDGKITDIKVLDHKNETPEFYVKAEAMVQKILQAQSTSVDTVSGATLSSNGILQAVIKALNQAVTDEKDKVAESSRPVVIPETTSGKVTTKKTVAKGIPADGTYTGSAECEKFGYTMTVKVTFKDGKATKIFDLKIANNDDQENEAYWTKAYKPTVKKILKSQSSDVDVVSGATYSSNAVMEAFEDAKAKAIKKNGGKAKTKTKTKTKKKEKTKDKKINDADIVTPEKVADGTYHVMALCEPDEDKDFEKYYMYADVTFANGKLVKIENLTSNAEGNKKYYQKAADGSKNETGVIDQLIKKQSAAGISAVSGATCSSKTIVLLYAEALKEAAGKEIAVELETTTEQETKETESTKSEETETTVLTLKDGIYYEEVLVEPDEYEEFDPYFLMMEISFEMGQFKNMEILSSTDDSNQAYYEKALNGTKKLPGVLAQLTANPLGVPDAVTGATCSSNSIYEAYRQACKEASK